MVTPEFAISFAVFVLVFLLLNRLGSAEPAGYAEDPDLARARQFIRTKIDEHAAALAQRYRDSRAQDSRGGRAADSFVREIEGFIGNVLLHDLELEHPELGPAMREVVTLEREQVYELVLSRVQAT